MNVLWNLRIINVILLLLLLEVGIVDFLSNFNRIFLSTIRWRKGTCKLGIGCTFAHGEEELTAWNEQLEKMKKDERKKKEKENDEQREDEFKVESKVSNADEDEDEVHPVPVYKVGIFGITNECACFDDRCALRSDKTVCEDYDKFAISIA